MPAAAPPSERPFRYVETKFKVLGKCAALPSLLRQLARRVTRFSGGVLQSVQVFEGVDRKMS